VLEKKKPKNAPESKGGNMIFQWMADRNQKFRHNERELLLKYR
jgi:hypothetical protein